ncbi:hypothetical protein [Thiolapillus sp.]|uniref:hypothetical protein n=1 Tax=Thiolapillus sp. TaxID=2017437 RepID=UPI0025FDB9B9|nr:hypothetical protein [Thiolapillus sp.]
MFSLWRKARRENSAASRLLGSTSLRFALHGRQRGCEAAGIGQYPEFQLPIGKGELCGFPRIMRHRERRHFDITDTEGWCMGAEQLQFRNVTTVGIPPGAVRHPHGHQACLRPRDRFWDIPVPKINSAFDNLFVPQPSWSPSTTQQLRKLVAAPYLAPI